MTKTSTGNFFEDFRLGQMIRHATPRTVTERRRRALHRAVRPALRGAVVGRPSPRRSAIRARRSTICWSSTSCSARPCRTSRSTRSPISAMPSCRFLAPVYPGDTLSAASEVIGLKENSNRKTGIVYVRSTGFKQDGTAVLEYVRWVMVRKRDEAAPRPADHVPRLPTAVEPRAAGRGLSADRRRGLRLRAGRQPASLRRLRGRREDRPRRRHHGRGGRAPDRDAALPEHRAHPFRPVRRRRAASAGG